MRKLTVIAQMTLDGVMQAPGGPEEDISGGFTEGGWSVNYWDAVLEESMGEAMAEPFDLLLGRRTYEIFAAHWPFDDSPVGELFNGVTKFVASRTLSELEWENSELLEGELADAVAAVKASEGPGLQVHGSTEMVQGLLGAGLVDEFRVLTFPVVVGEGKRLFGDGTVPTALELTESKTSSKGVIVASYRPVGAIEKGSFAHEEPTEQELERRRKAGIEDVRA